MIHIETAIVGFLGFFLLGALAERLRKLRDMRMDAENGVTFVAGVPHVFRRYGPEQNYED